MKLRVTKDEWGPTFDQLSESARRGEMRKFFGDIGAQTVSRIQFEMEKQRGFGDGKRYAPLVIEFRYHGEKSLVASAFNLKRRRRGAKVTTSTIGGKSVSQIAVTDKEKVDGSTQALIDTGDLWTSWAIRSHNANSVEVGPRAPLANMKALYNDDRGDWTWGKESGGFALNAWTGYWDEGIWK